MTARLFYFFNFNPIKHIRRATKKANGRFLLQSRMYDTIFFTAYLLLLSFAMWQKRATQSEQPEINLTTRDRYKVQRMTLPEDILGIIRSFEAAPLMPVTLQFTFKTYYNHDTTNAYIKLRDGMWVISAAENKALLF
jgi:hypothetical protein